MKKTLFGFMALATALAAVSCQSDEEFAQQPTNKPMVINAVAEGIGTGTRATMAYKYDILWNAGDEIYVKNNSGTNATFTLTAGQGTTNGTFACASSPFTSGDAVEAYYPASLIKGGNLVWPAEQKSDIVVPMYSKKTLGSTGSENFSFASLGAVLQIVFNTKQENVTLKSITLKDGTNPLSGTFTVNEEGKAVMKANATVPGITYYLGETGKALGDGANYFNIAVPAGTYSNLTITFTATDNSTCTLKGNVTLNHNKVGKLTLTGMEFKATTGTAKRTGDVEVNWVQLWAGGPKFAEYNVGAENNKAEDYGDYYSWANNIASTQWGDNWRMPTREEFDALLANCDVEWTNNYKDSDKKGRIFTGKGAYSSNSIFLPAAGTVTNPNGFGTYWSSTPDDIDNNAYALGFASDTQLVSIQGRAYGYSVRAVLAE